MRVRHVSLPKLLRRCVAEGERRAAEACLRRVPMSDEKPIGALINALSLRKASDQGIGEVSTKASTAVVPLRRETPPSPVQRELFADTSWFPVLRGLIQSGATAELGPYAIAAYIAMKANADFRTGR